METVSGVIHQSVMIIIIIGHCKSPSPSPSCLVCWSNAHWKQPRSRETTHVTGPYTTVEDEDQGQIRPFTIQTCPVIPPYWAVKAWLVIRRYFPVSVNGASYGRRILSCLKMIEIKHYIDRYLISSQVVLWCHTTFVTHASFFKNVQSQLYDFYF